MRSIDRSPASSIIIVGDASGPNGVEGVGTRATVPEGHGTNFLDAAPEHESSGPNGVEGIGTYATLLGHDANLDDALERPVESLPQPNSIAWKDGFEDYIVSAGQLATGAGRQRRDDPEATATNRGDWEALAILIATGSVNEYRAPLEGLQYSDYMAVGDEDGDYQIEESMELENPMECLQVDSGFVATLGLSDSSMPDSSGNLFVPTIEKNVPGVLQKKTEL